MSVLSIFHNMKKLLLYSIIAISMVAGISNAEAKPHWKRRHDDRHDHHDRDHDHGHGRYSHRTRTLYFIERGRPVSRVVYVHPSGYYYRVVSGRPVRIRERYYTSYPSRYFYPDGRRRVGIHISF